RERAAGVRPGGGAAGAAGVPRRRRGVREEQPDRPEAGGGRGRRGPATARAVPGRVRHLPGPLGRHDPYPHNPRSLPGPEDASGVTRRLSGRATSRHDHDLRRSAEHGPVYPPLDQSARTPERRPTGVTMPPHMFGVQARDLHLTTSLGRPITIYRTELAIEIWDGTRFDGTAGAALWDSGA